MDHPGFAAVLMDVNGVGGFSNVHLNARYIPNPLAKYF